MIMLNMNICIQRDGVLNEVSDMTPKTDTRTFHEKWQARVAFQCSCCFTNYTMDEMMKCYSVWVNGDEKYGKVGVCNVCGKKHHEGKWQIMSFKKPYVIYTTHLEMPAVSPNLFEDTVDSKYFWESMVQNIETGKWLEFQARYKTQQDAIDGHWIAYDHLEDMILNPEKYPQGFMGMFFNAIEAVQDQRKNIDPHVKRNLR